MSMRRELVSLKRHISLPEDAWHELDSNFDHYRHTISELLEQTAKTEEFNREIGHLNSEIARLNYKMYEMQMAVFTNAVKLSGLLAQSNLDKKKPPTSVTAEIVRILEKYLM